jgi:hypothetical protein
VLGLDGLELDGDLFAGNDVGAQVDVSERATTNLSTDAVLVANPKVLLMR